MDRSCSFWKNKNKTNKQKTQNIKTSPALLSEARDDLCDGGNEQWMLVLHHSAGPSYLLSGCSHSSAHFDIELPGGAAPSAHAYR